MAVLVTRPEPNEATAEALRGRGFTPLLAPLLAFHALPVADDGQDYSGVIVTSANAIRAIRDRPLAARIASLPVFAVGDATAAAATEAGFTSVKSSAGDAVQLHKLITGQGNRRTVRPLLYLRAEDVSRDMASMLKGDGIEVVSKAVYRMAMLPDLPAPATEAFAANGIEAVLHYSRRSAQAFVAAAARAGLSVTALGVPQICIAGAVADVLHQADAARVVSAAEPNESALLEALSRAVT